MASFKQNELNSDKVRPAVSAEQVSTPTFQVVGQTIESSSSSSSNISASEPSSVSTKDESVDSSRLKSPSESQVNEGAGATGWKSTPAEACDNIESVSLQEAGEQAFVGSAAQSGGPNRSGLSRSQPEITGEPNELSNGAITRRASIITDGSDRAGGDNLLHCAVYRSSSQHNGTSFAHCYQSSSNFESSLISTRSNSHNLLIRAEPASCARFELCTSQPRISNGTSSPQTTQVGLASFKQHPASNATVDAAYCWSKLNSTINNSSSTIANNLAIRSPNADTDAEVDEGDDDDDQQEHQHHQQQQQHQKLPTRNHDYFERQHLYLAAAGRQLSQSNQQLSIAKSSKRNGSSSSLASLRKSLVKLFC